MRVRWGGEEEEGGGEEEEEYHTSINVIKQHCAAPLASS